MSNDPFKKVAMNGEIIRTLRQVETLLDGVKEKLPPFVAGQLSIAISIVESICQAAERGAEQQP